MMSTGINRSRREVAGAVRTVLARVRLKIARAKATLTLTQFVASEGSMPSLDGATAWLNSRPLSPADLRGKVVLVQFWTYSCIEWLRTFPYLSTWADRYRDAGLVVIGVHTPEYSFEHDVDNVRRAANGPGIKYPIAIDNHYAISDAFKNRYTPALYVIDSKRRIRAHYLGEEGYDEAEQLIRRLLLETGAKGIGAEPLAAGASGDDVAPTGDDSQPPENYAALEDMMIGRPTDNHDRQLAYTDPVRQEPVRVVSPAPAAPGRHH